MATSLGEMLRRFPQAMPPGKVPAAENPANPNQVAMLSIPPPPADPVMPPQQPFNPAGPAGVGGYIPPAAHPTLRGKIGALFQNPDFNQALMVFGANAMRTPQAGQNYGDVFGDALLAGMGTYQGAKDKKKAETQQKTKDAEAAVIRAEETDLKRENIKLGREELDQRKTESQQRFKEAEADRISRENIAKIQAASREKAGATGGGMSAAEFAFGEAKKAYLTMGLTEDEAQQRAVKDVLVSQKAPSETSQGMQRYNSAVDLALQSWMRNPESLLANPAQAAQAIHQMAITLAQQSQAAGSQFAVPPAGVPPLGEVGAPTPTPTGEAAPIPTPAVSAGRGAPGNGTQGAPFNEQQAQSAADALRRPLKVWVINPATGQAENVTVTPGAR